MAEVPSVIGGLIFFMKFWEISLVDFDVQESKSKLILRRTVVSLVRDDRAVPVTEQELI